MGRPCRRSMRRPMMVSTFPMAGLRTGASWRCGRSSAPPPARSPARAWSSSNRPPPVECRWSPPATSSSSPGSRKESVPRRSYLYLVLLPALTALFIADTIASADIACAEGCAVQGAQAQQPTLSEMTTAFTQAGTTPCALLKAIAYVESSWHQATYSAALGSTGPTLVSFDCGYGIMQITSGMRNRGDLPNDVQERIAIDYLYNIGWGAKMLIDKWNLAPTYAPVVGDRNPAVAEAWYFAVWGFNGWSISNNPNY